MSYAYLPTFVDFFKWFPIGFVSNFIGGLFSFVIILKIWHFCISPRFLRLLGG